MGVVNYFRHPRASGKSTAFKLYLITLRAIGKGDELVMVCSPGDPTHIEYYPVWVEIDGEPYMTIDERTIYDHPVKTVNEWCKEWNL